MSAESEYTRPPPPAGTAVEETQRSRWSWIADSASRRVFIVALILLVALGGSWWWASTNGNGNQTATESTVSSIPTLDSTPGGPIQAESTTYQEAIERANDQGVLDAEAVGESFLPTVEETADPLDAGQNETVQEEPADNASTIAPVQVTDLPGTETGGTDTVLEVPVPEPRNPVGTGQELTENPFLQPIPQPELPPELPETADTAPENPMRAMMQAIVSGQRAWQPGARNLAGAEPHAARTPAAPERQPGATFAAAGDEPAIATGTVLTARMLTTADSDLGSGPAAADIVTGDHRMTRLTGSWRAAPQGILIEFDTAIPPGRSPVTIDGRGITLDDASPQVSDERQSRLLARYGPAFLLGAVAAGATSAATERCSETTTVTPAGQVITTRAGCERPSREEEALYGGLSAGIAAVTADVVANTPRGPRWLLHRGAVIGVLILAGTDVTRSPQQDSQALPAIDPAALLAPGVPLPTAVNTLLPAAAAIQTGVIR